MLANITIEAYEVNVEGERMEVKTGNIKDKDESVPVPALCTIDLESFDTDAISDLCDSLRLGYQFCSYELGFDIKVKSS